MTGRERVIAAIRREPVDRVPWIPECSWSYFASIPEYQKRFICDGREQVNPELRLEALAFRTQFYQERICGEFMQWCANPGVIQRYPHVSIREYFAGDTWTTVYQTPKGEIAHIGHWSATARSWFPERDLIMTRDDLEVFEFMQEDMEIEEDFESLRQELAVVGDTGVYFSKVPAAPLKSMMLGTLSLPLAAELLTDERSRMERLFALMHEKHLAIARLQMNSPAQVFMDASVIGVGMISPTWIREFYTPYSRAYADILHTADKLIVFHASGEPLLAVADEISKAGTDLQYGIAVPPRGEAPLSTLRSTIGSDVALAGGLEPSFLAIASADDVRHRTETLLDDMREQSGFLLGTADDVSWETSPELLGVVGQTIREYS